MGKQEQSKRNIERGGARHRQREREMLRRRDRGGRDINSISGDSFISQELNINCHTKGT